MTPTLRDAYQPSEPIPPGETLQEWLDRAGMTQAEFAKRASLTPKHINHVVKGAAGISAEVAIAFERVTAIPAQYWTQLEANFQTARQRTLETQVLKDRVSLLSHFPVAELVRRGAIPRRSEKVEQLRELLRFFAVADPDALETVWLQPALYRTSKSFVADSGALASWLRLAELKAPQVEPFNLSACRASIDQMRRLSTLPGIDWFEPLQALCASVGIALVILKGFPKSRVNGATRWLTSDKALVAMSLRHLRNDIFWFTFFHELCHVLRHSKKDTFVDSDDGGTPEALETEADAFAARTLIPASAAATLHELSTEAQVVAFAESIGVAPGIVVGRMQHDNLIAPNQLTTLFVRYQFVDE